MTADRWHQLSLMGQMANIGAEVNRLISWQQKGNPEFATNACYRAINHLNQTLSDPKNKPHLKEICRAKEALSDWYFGHNNYQTSQEFWQSYFLPFTLLGSSLK